MKDFRGQNVIWNCCCPFSSYLGFRVLINVMYDVVIHNYRNLVKKMDVKLIRASRVCVVCTVHYQNRLCFIIMFLATIMKISPRDTLEQDIIRMGKFGLNLVS